MVSIFKNTPRFMYAFFCCSIFFIFNFYAMNNQRCKSKDLLNQKPIQEELERIKLMSDFIPHKKIFVSNSTIPLYKKLFETKAYQETALLFCIYYGKTKDAKKILRLFPDCINTVDEQKRSILHILINGMAAQLFFSNLRIKSNNPLKLESINSLLETSTDYWADVTLQDWFSLFHFIFSRNIKSKVLYIKNKESLSETISALQTHVRKEFKKLSKTQLDEALSVLEKMRIESITDSMIDNFPKKLSNKEIVEHISLTAKSHAAVEQKEYRFIEPYLWHNFFFTAIRKHELQLISLFLKKEPALIFARYPLNKKNLTAFEYYLQLPYHEKKVGELLITKSFSSLKYDWEIKELHNLFKKILFKQIKKNNYDVVEIIIKNIPEAVSYSTKKSDETPLHKAAKNKQWKTITLLIKNGAQLELMDIEGKPPLAYFFGKTTGPFKAINRMNPDVIRENILPNKKVQHTHCFTSLCRKYVFALSPLTNEKKLSLTKKQQKIYGLYFTKTPQQSFTKQYKKHQ